MDDSDAIIVPMTETKPDNPQEAEGRHFARRMAAFYASVFVALGVHMPFLPVWFAAKGLDPQTIGVVLAMPMILRLFAIPMATRLADRYDAPRAVIMAATLAALAGFGTLGLVRGPQTIGVLYAVSATAFMMLFVLSDVYALRGLAPLRRAYGPVRLWGSVAFIAANVAAGYLLDIMVARDLIWLVVAAVSVCLATGWALPPLAARSSGAPGEAPSARALIRNRAFLAVTVASSFIQGSHGLYYGFSTIDWRAAGYGGGTIGMLWALGVLAEIVLFASSARLPAAIGPSVLILIGGAGAVVRWIAMALDPPSVLLPFLQCLHGLSFGATHLGTLGIIGRAVPTGLTATAQGYLAVSSGVAIAVATGLSGLLYARFGTTAYGAMALIAAGGLVAAWTLHRVMANVVRN
jgi:MFS transporter, PPP family, 3-phenylpropionic acid transporter